MFKKKNEFREKLLRERQEEINYQTEKIRQRKKELRDKRALEYCKKVCEEYKKEEYKRKEQAREILRVLDRV